MDKNSSCMYNIIYLMYLIKSEVEIGKQNTIGLVHTHRNKKQRNGINLQKTHYFLSHIS